MVIFEKVLKHKPRFILKKNSVSAFPWIRHMPIPSLHCVQSICFHHVLHFLSSIHLLLFNMDGFCWIQAQWASWYKTQGFLFGESPFPNHREIKNSTSKEHRMHYNKATTLLITFAILSFASASDAPQPAALMRRNQAEVNKDYGTDTQVSPTEEDCDDAGVVDSNETKPVVVVEDCPEDEVLAAEEEDCEDETPVYQPPVDSQVVNSEEKAPVVIEECEEEEILGDEDCVEEEEKEGMHLLIPNP
jgi:hypothetical protein